MNVQLKQKIAFRFLFLLHAPRRSAGADNSRHHFYQRSERIKFKIFI